LKSANTTLSGSTLSYAKARAFFFCEKATLLLIPGLGGAIELVMQPLSTKI
jgi:hypothetical protein